MSPASRAERVRDPERTRELVLDAGAQEFWLHGLEGARVQIIAERAGTTRGGMYHHFVSKQQIAEELVEHESVRWRALIESIAASGRGLDAIGRFLVAAAEHAENDIRARAVLHIVRELPDVRGAAGVPAWRDFFVRGLQQAIADGDVSDAIDAAQAAAAVTDSLFGVIALPSEPGTNAAERAAVVWALLEPGLRSHAR